jgi:hypothetical protein
MVVLVTRQGSATCERLLAVRVGTFVRALAGVDATVTSQRARVTEGLGGGLEKASKHATGNVPCRNAHTCGVSRPCGHVDGLSAPSAG